MCLTARRKHPHGRWLMPRNGPDCAPEWRHLKSHWGTDGPHGAIIIHARRGETHTRNGSKSVPHGTRKTHTLRTSVADFGLSDRGFKWGGVAIFRYFKSKADFFIILRRPGGTAKAHWRMAISIYNLRDGGRPLGAHGLLACVKNDTTDFTSSILFFKRTFLSFDAGREALRSQR